MKYAGIIKNDVCAAPGVCVSFFTQGCPHRCPGCHNPETWTFVGGKWFSAKVIDEILEALTANGIQRKFCIMGGEPLCRENLGLTSLVIDEVKYRFPDLEIYLWTGYTVEELQEFAKKHGTDDEYGRALRNIIKNLTCIIDGRYEESLRDITLPMRGSSNQNIYYLDKVKIL